MQRAIKQPRSDKRLAPDWSTLGRLVQRRTLEAVSLHFAELAAGEAAGHPIEPSGVIICEERAG